MKIKKQRIAIFKYSCCAGCEFQLIYFQKYILETLEALDIVYCKMLQSGGMEEGPFDIALIEGAITEEWQEYSVTTPILTEDVWPANIQFVIGHSTGDFWIDSDDDNKMYRWSGGAWVSVQDGTIATAQSAADAAQADADLRVTTFIQTSVLNLLRLI